MDSNAALAPGVLSALASFEGPAYFTTGNHEAYVDKERALKIIARQGIAFTRRHLLLRLPGGWNLRATDAVGQFK